MEIEKQELVGAIAKLMPKTPDWCLFWQYQWDATCMSKSEWSGWMQAAGATAAIVWALWLYAADRCKVRKREWEIAEVAAVAVYRMLVRQTSVIAKHRGIFDSASENFMDMACFSNFVRDIDAQPLPSGEQILALRPLLKDCTATLANGIAYLNDACVAASVTPDDPTFAARLKQAKIVLSLLDDAVKRLNNTRDLLGHYEVV